MTTHALFRPSGAHRWVNCPSSLVWEQDYPDTDSAHADEGTAAHLVAAAVLNGEYDFADQLVGQRIEVRDCKTVLVTDEMASYVQDYVDYVKALADHAPIMVEQRVTFGPLCGQDASDDYAGTADALILRGDHLYVVDLKYGAGVRVSPQDNEQLMLYALGGMYTFDGVAKINTVTMVISQPRAGGTVENTLPAKDLLKWGSTVVRKGIDAGNTVVAAGDRNNLAPGSKTCQWCPAKAVCPALRSFVENATALDFDDLTKAQAADPGQSEADALSKAMSATDLVEQWLRATRSEVEKRLIRGDEIPGWKLVAGRKGQRQWTDAKVAEDTLVEALGGAAYKKTILSPAQAEKELRKTPHWEPLQKLTVQKDGPPSVAPASDKRKTWQGTPADAFEDLGEEER